MAHAQFIRALGGVVAVAGLCDVSTSTAGNWGKRGVAPEHRPKLALKAMQEGVPLPDGFLDPEVVAAISRGVHASNDNSGSVNCRDL